jgi:hypothetical protein
MAVVRAENGTGSGSNIREGSATACSDWATVLSLSVWSALKANVGGRSGCGKNCRDHTLGWARVREEGQGYISWPVEIGEERVSNELEKIKTRCAMAATWTLKT